jgi:nucleotide-binding universal stress UspA family protein
VSHKELVDGAKIASEAAERGCDMIITETRGYGFVGLVFMGSVAQSVVNDSKIPVLLVK